LGEELVFHIKLIAFETMAASNEYSLAYWLNSFASGTFRYVFGTAGLKVSECAGTQGNSSNPQPKK